MNLADLVNHLEQNKVALRSDGDRLIARGRAVFLNDAALVASIRLHKGALLRNLSAAAGGDSARGLLDGSAATQAAAKPTHLSASDLDRLVAQIPGGTDNLQDIYPLAPLQEGILFHHLMSDQGDPYVLHVLLGFDDRDRLTTYLSALQAVIDRHDIFRTAVHWEGLKEPVQVVWRSARLVVEEVRPDPAKGDIARQLRERFDARHYRLDVRVAPLMRVAIARDDVHSRWLASLLCHHLAIDHVTFDDIQKEVTAHLLGHASALPKAEGFRTFVAQARRANNHAEHEAFFRGMLGTIDQPTLPFGLANADVSGTDMTEARHHIDPALESRLRLQARALMVSVASLCHVAWAHVLASATGQREVVFGTVLLGRMQTIGQARMMGLFINTLPIRVRPDFTAECVQEVHRTLGSLLRHEHASLALAQRCSGVKAPAPLFVALLNFRHAERADALSREAWAGIRELSIEEHTNYPLVLSIDDFADELTLTSQVVPPLDAQHVCLLMQRALEDLVDALERGPPVARMSTVSRELHNGH